MPLDFSRTDLHGFALDAITAILSNHSTICEAKTDSDQTELNQGRPLLRTAILAIGGLWADCRRHTETSEAEKRRCAPAPEELEMAML